MLFTHIMAKERMFFMLLMCILPIFSKNQNILLTIFRFCYIINLLYYIGKDSAHLSVHENGKSL